MILLYLNQLAKLSIIINKIYPFLKILIGKNKIKPVKILNFYNFKKFQKKKGFIFTKVLINWIKIIFLLIIIEK